MLRHRQGDAHAEPQPGFILTYHGSDIGVVERVDVPDHRGSRLYVRGGPDPCATPFPRYAGKAALKALA